MWTTVHSTCSHPYMQAAGLLGCSAGAPHTFGIPIIEPRTCPSPPNPCRQPLGQCTLAHTHTCRLLECWAALPVPLTAGQVQAGHLVVDESLRSAAPDIQAAAVATLRALSCAYLPQLGLEVGLEPESRPFQSVLCAASLVSPFLLGVTV